MMSNAQLSDATQRSPPSVPSESGRSPAGSRKATTASFVITTVEKAPSSRGTTSATASSMRSASWVERSAAMISESEVPRNWMPCLRSSAWSSTALIRFPLCASATCRRSERHTGWAFSHADEPVVE